MSEAMSAEFDTIAEWTAEVAADLGKEYWIPAACRGSGSTAALDWLLERMAVGPETSLLDCGAGMGGPAAYARERTSVQPVLVEPEAGACRAARSLFDHPVVQGSATELPVPDGSFDAVWSLGVLCTMSDQLGMLTEVRRVVRDGGRIGLLVFMARTSAPLNVPDGNDFPTEDGLRDLLARAELTIEARRPTEGLPAASEDWQRRVEAVTDELTARHSGSRAWELAEQQGERISTLLADHAVTGELLILRR